MSLRILITSGIFPPDAGGPASYVPRIAVELIRLGHRVEVVCLSDRVDHDDSEWGFPVHRVRRARPRVLRIIETVAITALLSWRSDVVFVNGLSEEAAFASWITGRRTVHKIVGDYAWERARSLGWFNGSIEDYQTSAKPWKLRILDALRTLPLRQARSIIVPSKYLQTLVQGWDLNNSTVSVVYNAVEPAIGLGKQSRVGPHVPVLVTVCRLVSWKGVEALIGLLPSLPDVNLEIIGDGPEREFLTAFARGQNVAERTTFLGTVDSIEVTDRLRRASIFVLNSSYEGLPHVVLEAMTAGTPVIATDAGGTCEIVQNEVTGLLVPVGDPAALHSAVVRLLRDPDLAYRLTLDARAMLAEHFSLEQMVLMTERSLVDVD